jgi:glycerol-3-phosphate acyltransferase PlsY
MGWQFPLAVVLAYGIGAIPSGYLIGKVFRRIDIREHGSGNIGATNTLRVLGKPAGIAALILDVAKGVVAVTVLAGVAASGRSPLSLPVMKVLLGIAAIAGHNWTVFLRFKGGKGVATSAGVFLGIAWLPVLIAAAVFAVVVLSTRIVSVGSMSAAVVLPLAMLMVGSEREFIWFSIVVAGLVLLRHSSNIKRLLQGKEHRF